MGGAATAATASQQLYAARAVFTGKKVFVASPEPSEGFALRYLDPKGAIKPIVPTGSIAATVQLLLLVLTQKTVQGISRVKLGRRHCLLGTIRRLDGL